VTIDDTDLKQRLRLAQEKIARLEREIEDLNDLRETLREILTRPIQDDPQIREWVDWSRNAVELVKAKERMQPTKKSPAVHRAELTRLWAAERGRS